MMRSIRTFLAISIVATITLVNFVSALHGYQASMREAEALLNQRLSQQMELLSVYLDASIKTRDSQEYPLKVRSIYSEQGGGAIAFQVWDADQNLIVYSANAPDRVIAKGKEGFFSFNFNGLRWHALAKHDNRKKLWLLLAERDDLRYQLAERVIIESILPTVLAIPVIVIMVWLIVSFGLRPIGYLSRRLKEKQVSDLSPIQLDKVPKELNMLAASANDLLSRLDASFEREKRFASDAAHELRTPLAGLKIHLENLLNELGSVPSSGDKLKECVDRMGHLIEQILLLNRTTPDHFFTQFACIDLAESIRSVVANCYQNISEKEQVFEFSGESCEIYGDLFALETMMQNLLLNAIKYTPKYGHILIRIVSDNDNVVLKVIDDGPGIPREQYDRVFERFYRVGGDRHSSSVVGCGLGLAIVKHIVDLHQATIELEDSEFPTGLTVKVSFPKNILCQKGERIVNDI